jgi:hypothetical protein
VLLALLGVALCAAAFLATRGAQDPGGSVTAVPAPAAPAPHASSPQAKKHTPPARKHAGPKAKSEPKHSAPTKPVAPSAAALAAVETGAQAVAQPDTAAPKPPTTSKPKASLAARVKSALARGDAVVFLFTRAGAADDTGTRQSVQTLNGMKRVMVVKAGLADLTDFRPVLAGAGVSQVPSVVIVHKGEPGRLIEGYVDAGTLRQNVADALR